MLDFQRFDKFISPEPNSGCWLWTGNVDKDGYALFKYSGKTTRAHRLAFKIKNGFWPLITDHLCRVHCCVNPNHMESVTVKVNTLRGLSIQAHNARKRECKRGHQLNGDNLIVIGRRRICRKCKRWHDRDLYQRSKGQAA